MSIVDPLQLYYLVVMTIFEINYLLESFITILSLESMGQRLFAIGSFIGEVIINEYGGKWITDDEDLNGEINIAVELPNGVTILPVQRVMKRCMEGPENDIYNYVVITCTE